MIFFVRFCPISTTKNLVSKILQRDLRPRLNLGFITMAHRAQRRLPEFTLNSSSTWTPWLAFQNMVLNLWSHSTGLGLFI
jgi:hypothetical protein